MHTFHKFVLPVLAHFLSHSILDGPMSFSNAVFHPRYLLATVSHKTVLFCALISPLQLSLQADISATASRFICPMKVHQNVILWGNTAQFRRLKSWNGIYSAFCTRNLQCIGSVAWGFYFFILLFYQENLRMLFWNSFGSSDISSQITEVETNPF